MSACGRIGFAPSKTADDATTVRHTCSAKSTAPDLLTINSFAFSYLDFRNTRAPLSGATIQAYDATETVRGETTTAADGTYTLSIATGGIAPTLSVHGSFGGDWKTDEFFDAPIDTDLSAVATDTLPFGEVPIWTKVAMGAIYSRFGTSHDPALGTVNVTTLDCSGHALGGVTVTLDPPAQLSLYLDVDGNAALDVTGTITPYALQLSTNVTPGPIHITANKPGYEFAPVDIAVKAGDFNTLVELRPLM